LWLTQTNRGSGKVGIFKIFPFCRKPLLFTSISKEVIDKIGEKNGEKLIRKAVRKYGQQRGKRMALRAKKNGHDLTVANYFAYGEWEVPKYEMDFKLIEKNPDARLNIFKCPWYAVWKENNLLQYGKYFCKEIDIALVNGFNPELELKVNSTQTNGEVIKHELGPAPAADVIMENALTNFVKFSSKDHIEIIKKYLNTDFDKLPQ